MYQVRTVFKDLGLIKDYYVLNIKTKKVQSVWTSIIDAKKICNSLNTHSKTLKEVK